MDIGYNLWSVSQPLQLDFAPVATLEWLHAWVLFKEFTSQFKIIQLDIAIDQESGCHRLRKVQECEDWIMKTTTLLIFAIVNIWFASASPLPPKKLGTSDRGALLLEQQ